MSGASEGNAQEPAEATSIGSCAVILAPTATNLGPNARGAVVVCGSHGGRYPGFLAAKARVRAVIFSDAGIGLEEAGIAGLRFLDRYGIAAGAVSHMSCRIGDPEDAIMRGILSHVNGAAAALGVSPGMSCCRAAELLRTAPLNIAELEPDYEARKILQRPGARPLVLVDSASLVEEADRGAIVVTGSHGGLVGGDPMKALRVDAHAAVFNDAGIGIDNAGIARLPALECRGIPAFTVAADSARIGEARSTLDDGIISAANAAAQNLGVRIGERANAAIERFT